MALFFLAPYPSLCGYTSSLLRNRLLLLEKDTDIPKCTARLSLDKMAGSGRHKYWRCIEWPFMITTVLSGRTSSGQQKWLNCLTEKLYVLSDLSLRAEQGLDAVPKPFPVGIDMWLCSQLEADIGRFGLGEVGRNDALDGLVGSA
jgi:hypothetical protein